MIKKETKTIEVDVTYSDITGKEIEKKYVGRCGLYGKHVNCHYIDGGKNDVEDSCEDRQLCIECTKKGYRMVSDRGGVGIKNLKGKLVNCPYL